MNNCKSILCVLGFALACTVAAIAGDAPKLTFTFSKANVPGAMQTGPSGINNAGVIVGGYVDKESVSNGYILNGKKLTNIAVVRQLVKIGKLDKGKTFDQPFRIKLWPGADPANLRVIAFVQESGPGKVLGAGMTKDIQRAAE